MTFGFIMSIKKIKESINHAIINKNYKVDSSREGLSSHMVECSIILYIRTSYVCVCVCVCAESLTSICVESMKDFVKYTGHFNRLDYQTLISHRYMLTNLKRQLVTVDLANNLYIQVST